MAMAKSKPLAMAPSPAKRALRKQVASALALLSRQDVASQSEAVLARLAPLLVYTASRCAAVYLPMEGGGEVDTWPILADLLSRGVKVGVPRVTGPGSGDMHMLRIDSLEQARALPKNAWGIPEPDDALAASMEDMTAGAEFDLLLAPGVAFDARCNRLGHGRGYYDCFIKSMRARGGVAVVGVALREQIQDAVPVDAHDERLDLVVHPDGLLAFASAADAAAAAAYARERQCEDGSPGGGDEGTQSSGAPEAAGVELVELAEGRYKYACLRLRRAGESFLAVRSGPGAYHSDVAEPAIQRYKAAGFLVEPLGGGRIVVDSQQRTAFVYGYSYGYGGSEGGPPGHGMSDHSEAAALIRRACPDYTTTFSPDGY